MASAVLALAAAGCGAARPAAPVEPVAAAGSEVSLEAAPKPGMRVAYQVRSTATLSGAGVESLSRSQRSATVSQRYVLEVTAVTPESFVLRVVEGDLPGTLTARLSPDWTVLRFGLDEQGQFEALDPATFPVLGEALRLSRDLAGHWRVGQARPWEWAMSFSPQLRVRMKGTAALKRIVATGGRRAAEFEYGATGEGEYLDSPIRIGLSGQARVDLATGFLLETRSTAPGEFSQSGQPVRIEITEEQTLDRAGTAGF